MGTRYLFKKAVKISQGMLPQDKRLVHKRCNSIRISQEELVAVADAAMFNCIEKCRGICCKNLDIDSVFSLWDFIFILTLAPRLKEEIQNRLDAYNALYLSPCPFLKESKGPCIFPSNIKAQICIITFCTNDEIIKKYIRTVNLNFYKLCWLIQYLRIKRFAQKIGLLFTGKKPSTQ